MRLLVTGYKGQLGFDVVNEAQKRGIEAIGVDIEEMDITDRVKVNEVITEGNYDAVIHCAAWTAVDKAEEESLYDKVYAVNALGTKYIAEICAELDIPMMYFSTDYVFNGEGKEPWNEYDQRNPLNVYGLTKAKGEEYVEKIDKHFIIRIAWVFGVNGSNFIKTMLRLGKERGAVKVVDDQIGLPTYTYDLARLVIDMIQTDKYGTYHATNSGSFISWYDFACEIFKQAGLVVDVAAVSSEEFPAAAKRPHNSRMNQTELDKNGFERLPDWKNALERYLAIINS